MEELDFFALTLHKLFGLNFESGSKLNFDTRTGQDEERLLGTLALLIDEGSMLDTDFYDAIVNVLESLTRAERTVRILVVSIADM